MLALRSPLNLIKPINIAFLKFRGSAKLALIPALYVNEPLEYLSLMGRYSMFTSELCS